MVRGLCLPLLFLLLPGFAQAQSLWDKTKSAVGSTVEVVGDTAKSAGSAISGEKEDPNALRAKIDKMASDAITRLTSKSPQAKSRFDKAAGYAVFDTRKLSLLISTGFGSGVAVDKGTAKPIYMKMATGGVNLGYGVQSFQVIFLFPDNLTLTDFVQKGWEADAEATAAANSDKADAAMRLGNGVFVYKLNEKGVALSATLTGTKYWKDGDLN